MPSTIKYQMSKILAHIESINRLYKIKIKKSHITRKEIPAQTMRCKQSWQQ